MKSKKYLYLLLIVMLAFCVVSVPMTVGTVLAEDNNDVVTFQKTGDITIAQITDTHYFPLGYCGIDPNGNNNEYILGTKLLIESGLIIKQGLQDIINAQPDYLLVTGDITYNGEIQGHIDMANLLREVQNEIRKTNPSFQVFVTPGNHDIYNQNAIRFINGIEQQAPTVDRADFMKIYSSLGYPDMNSTEMDEYYDTLLAQDAITADFLPYTPDTGKMYVNSTNASDITLIYQYDDNQEVFDNGEITYIAYCPNDYVIIGIDEEVGGRNQEIQHHTGGKLFDGTLAFLNDKKDTFEDKIVIGAFHHNLIPHFPLENTLLKDFTLYNWRESADFLADLGMRYAFTGHMHSNDIISHVSFNGNYIMDTETSSLTGYKGGVRYVKIENGMAGDAYAENYKSVIKLVGEVDFTQLIDGGWMDEDYLVDAKLSQFVEKRGSKYICTDASEYAANKLFINIIEGMVYPYLDPDFLLGLTDMLGNANADNVLSGVLEGLLPIANKLIQNLITHLENNTLADYKYNGDVEKFKSQEFGYKLCGYVADIIEKAINIPVNKRGDTLFDFGMGSYLHHVGGTDIFPEDADAHLLEALENFKNGSIVKALLDILLDEQTGLLRLVKGLTEPMDLGKNMRADELEILDDLFGNILAPRNDKGKILTGFVFNSNAVVLDDHVNSLLSFLEIMGIEFSLEGKTISDFIDDLIGGYVTSSFYSGLGEIAYNILYQFNIDDTHDGSFDEYTIFLPNKKSSITYVEGTIQNEPSIENGKLPSMLTVSFGADPKTDKNFVWFTDRRVTGTDIQYMIGDFDEATAIQKAGDYQYIATTTAAIDLGIFATLLPLEIGRHTVEINSLFPDTVYSYRVGSAIDNYWSPVYTFKTAPADNKPFEVLLMTDLQGFASSTYSNANTIMNNMNGIFNLGYDFVLNCGDLVDNSRNLVQFEWLFNEMREQWGNTTQVVAVGNHGKYEHEVDTKNEDWKLYLSDEVDKSSYNYVLSHYNFSLPEQDTATGAYYSFDYSGVHFTVLNTNDITKNNRLSNKQIAWLKADLESAKDKIKVVAMHKGPYTAGSHNVDKDVVGIRKQVTSIFADNDVSLVLQGHDHTYTESYYLDRDGRVVDVERDESGKIKGDGVLYINLGSMGDKFYNYIDNGDVPIEFGQSKHSPTLLNPTFGKLYYDGNSLYYVGYEYDLATDSIQEIRYIEPEIDKPISDGKKLSTWEIVAIVVGSVVGAVAIAAGVIVVIKKSKKAKKAS